MIATTKNNYMETSMKNGTYANFADLGLAKNINFFYFNSIRYLERELKKGKELDEPVAIIIKGDSNLVVPKEGDIDKKEFVASLKVACHFLGAEAIIVFTEASRWTGTEEERQFVMEQMGEIHGHVKSKDALAITIETQGKYIVGHADVTSNGKQREIGQMEWVVMDLPDPSHVIFSNFLATKVTEAA